MDIDLVIAEPIVHNDHSPRNLFKLTVVSAHGPKKREFIKVGLIEKPEGVIPRLKILMYYFELVEQLGYIPNNEYLLEAFERKVYDEMLEIDSAQFWNHIVGYDMETGMNTFATPISYTLTFHDNWGIEKRVGIVIS
jgi:hypothetical protein